MEPSQFRALPEGTRQLPLLLNNRRRRDHPKLYGSNAFYDLDLSGPQAMMALDLGAGDECVVATPANDDNVIEFNWFRFSHEDRRPNENGVEVRVLFGEFLRSEQLDRTKATETEPYSKFFNVRGHFKRPSVIK